MMSHDFQSLGTEVLAAAGSFLLFSCGIPPEPDGGEPTLSSSSSLQGEALLHQSGIADAGAVPIEGSHARALLGSSQLPVRPATYSLLGAATRNGSGAPLVYVPVFEALDDSEGRASLAASASTFFGAKFNAGSAIERRLSHSLPVDGGVAWSPRGTSALWLASHDGVRGMSSVRDAKDAVNRALDQIAELGLVQLAPDETLDLFGVASTHYAGWSAENDGAEAKPVMFFEGDGKPVTSYESEYTVSFGRRYRGIPIEGADMSATLDATGRMVRFARAWRAIVGERAMPVTLLSETEVASRHDPNLAGLQLKEMRCGFLESSSLTYKQEAPGVGCVYEYDNPEGRGTLAGMRYDRISLTDDPSVPLEGERLTGK